MLLLWKDITAKLDRCRSLHSLGSIPFDLGHNFVLAHERPCNSKKADMLASTDHLNKWADRNGVFRDELRARFDSAHVVHNLHVSTRIAQWAYQQTFAIKGLTWRYTR